MAKDLAAERKMQLLPEGLHGMHYGYRLGNNYFPPSEFAMAWIGVNKPARLEEYLHAEVDRIVNGDEDAAVRADVPFLFEAVKRAQKEKRMFGLDDLRLLADKAYGTTKIIDGDAVLDVNSSEHKGTLSVKNTLSMKIDSRRARTAKNPAHKITLYNIVIEKPGDALSFGFEGGSMHAQKNLAKNTHWSTGLPHERRFMTDLAEITEKAFKDSKKYRVNQREVLGDYTSFVHIVDYTVACGLIKADEIARMGSSRIKSLRLDRGQSILLPYDFNRAPRYAFEAFLKAHTRVKLPGDDGDDEVRRRLFNVDTFFIGKSGFGTEMFSKLMTKDLATKEVVMSNKRFTGYSWSIIQAWEEYFYSQGRRFSGYAMEFPGQQSRTISIIFDDRINPDLSVRIIYDQNLGMPYLLYKTRIPVTDNIRVSGLKTDPLSRVNWAKGEHDGVNPRIRWIDRDSRTGNVVSCSIYEPRQEIRARAAALSKGAGTGTSAYALKGRYIANMKAHRNR